MITTAKPVVRDYLSYSAVRTFELSVEISVPVR